MFYRRRAGCSHSHSPATNGATNRALGPLSTGGPTFCAAATEEIDALASWKSASSYSPPPPRRHIHATARALRKHHPPPPKAHERDESSESLGGDGALRPLPRVAPPELPLHLLVGALLRRSAPRRLRPGAGRRGSWRRADLDPVAQGEDRDVLADLLRCLHRWRNRQLRAHPHGRHAARPRQVQHAGEFVGW